MSTIHLQIEIFILLFTGFWLAKKGMITKTIREGLTSLVISLFLPASIILSFTLDITPQILQSCLMVFFASIAIQLFYWIVSKIAWKKITDHEKQKVLDYATMVSNAGFMGMPIAAAVFGSQGLLYASIFLIPQRIVMWSYGLALFAGSSSAMETIKKVALHPCIIALGIGVIVLLFQMNGIVLPQWAMSSLDAIGGCTTALSMMVIGALLADVSFSAFFNPLALVYSFVRLVLIPACIFACFMLLNMQSVGAWVCVLESAMPAASTTAMLAAKYDGDAPFASVLIFVSTLLSLIALPVWMFLLS